MEQTLNVVGTSFELLGVFVAALREALFMRRDKRGRTVGGRVARTLRWWSTETMKDRRRTEIAATSIASLLALSLLPAFGAVDPWPTPVLVVRNLLAMLLLLNWGAPFVLNSIGRHLDVALFGAATVFASGVGLQLLALLI